MSKYVTPLSCLGDILERLRALLSKCDSLQEICETIGSAETEERIITVAVATDPENGEEYSINELENELCYVQLWPMDGGHSAIRRQDTSSTAEINTTIHVYIQRQVRDGELKGVQAAGAQDMWMWFTDRVARVMEHEIWDRANISEGLYINSIVMAEKPAFLPVTSESGQGQRLQTSFAINIGNVDE